MSQPSVKLAVVPRGLVAGVDACIREISIYLALNIRSQHKAKSTPRSFGAV